MGEIRYVDTRGAVKEPMEFTEAVVHGLAPGGGLFVPEEIPALSLEDICGLAELPYAQRAARIYRAFGVDLTDAQLGEITTGAYGANFDDERICPMTSLPGDVHMLELWHGPTSAFKDMALQCLPRFFSTSAAELRARGKLSDKHMILVATSGDTGKAALEGFCDVDGVSIGVMYPDGGVSDIQFKQMATQRGSNVRVWGVRGNFDDCQTGAKTVFDDDAFAKSLHDEYQIALSSANSINWGRLMPQIVYYVSAYAQLVADGKVERGTQIDVCVPTGNFGNILAAYYARRMGTPIRRLLCASNENRVLTDFINTGTYDISDREFVKTPSPSMDILVSSNLERQLFELTGRDSAAIAGWMTDLKQSRRFKVDRDTFAGMRELYSADSVDNAECLETIREVFERDGYLMDPHTAVAYKVAERLREDDVPVVVASTAHWAKFGNNVYRALHGIALDEELPGEVSALTGCELNKLIARETGVDNVPFGLSELDDLPIRFTEVIDGNADAIKEAVCAFLEFRG
ncbi:MAG: threonine synthase [Coriobacteriaceae bacterium]|nr:threonine synthase [Coriobacteriaceae bacterium]